MLSRSSLKSGGIYLIFNSISVFIFVGRAIDKLILQELFEVNDIRMLDLARTESTMFSEDRI